MTQLSLSHTLVAGTPENVNDVQANFDDIVAWANGNISESNMLSSSGLFAGYRTLKTAEAWVGASVAASYFFAGNQGSATQQNIVQSTTLNFSPPLSIYFDDADYTISGKTQRLRVRGQCYTNQTAPALTMTLGLYPISSVAGTSDAVNLTLGTVVSGSTVAFASPSASSLNQGNSGDFAIPADGHYVPGVAFSANLPAGSGVILAIQLQTRYV
jgi:hypothetical protein